LIRRLRITSIAGSQQANDRGPEAGLLSSEASAAVDTAFNTLAQTVKKHQPTLDDVVRALLPMLKSWFGRKFAELGRADGAVRNRAGCSGTPIGLSGDPGGERSLLSVMAWD
jgi:hypothetical protein